MRTQSKEKKKKGEEKAVIGEARVWWSGNPIPRKEIRCCNDICSKHELFPVLQPEKYYIWGKNKRNTGLKKDTTTVELEAQISEQLSMRPIETLEVYITEDIILIKGILYKSSNFKSENSYKA